MSGAIRFTPIGLLRSGHARAEETPIQPVYAQGSWGRAEVFPEYAEGLQDIESFSHVFLIYHLHLAAPAGLIVKPFLQDRDRGVFATCHPGRPNAIGMSLVALLRREGRVLHLDGADFLDGTPLLDIKPYAARFHRIERPRSGWHEEVDEAEAARRGRRSRFGADGASRAGRRSS
jgi:tRNA-Thr(GGU) m(6)t(6)A37 methyltransferase TsaA